jgi:ubiquinol-cytochrome c reductase cytochrome c1 subunit
MWKITFNILFLVISVFSFTLANSSEKNLLNFSSSLPNLASIQRGAKYFMNYCSGCHSLQYMRYNQLESVLKVDDKSSSTIQQRLKNNLVFTQAKTSDTIKSNLLEKESVLWFGKLPPDLSLSTRARGAVWVYNYLLSFYLDDTRPFGVNNNLIKNTAMPDPLAMLRKDRHTYYKLDNTNKQLPQITSNVIDTHLNKNRSKVPVFEEVATDLVNFLVYIAEPTKYNRQSLGKKVCGFLLLFNFFVYILKRQIWKNIEIKSFS